MPALVVLPAARADLIAIGDYIADDNPRRARSFVAEIETIDVVRVVHSARDLRDALAGPA